MCVCVRSMCVCACVDRSSGGQGTDSRSTVVDEHIKVWLEQVAWRGSVRWQAVVTEGRSSVEMGYGGVVSLIWRARMVDGSSDTVLGRASRWV